MSICLDQDQLRTALEYIAHSGTDSAEHLRHLAARALHCGAQPESLEQVDDCLTALNTDAKVGDTVKRMLKDNSIYPLPRIYLHGTEGKVALVWQCGDGVELLLVVGVGYFEMLKLSNGRLAVRREHVAFSGGQFDQSVSKYLPLKTNS